MKGILLIIGVCALALCINSTEATNSPQYTPDEKEALAKFSEMVKDILYLDYQRSDSYLISWLRAKQLDLGKAKAMLEKSLTWRRENGIDHILEEKEMLNFRQAFPFSLDGIDKENRPIFETSFGKWHIRKYVLAGKIEQLKRYTTYQYEAGLEKVREVAARTKANVTQYISVTDLNGFNLRQHMCLPCLSILVDSASQTENHYPDIVHSYILVNAPRIFTTLVSNYRNLFSQEIQKRSHLFGFDKAEWRPYLSNLIDDSQLSPEFGGTKGQGLNQ